MYGIDVDSTQVTLVTVRARFALYGAMEMAA